MDQDTLNRIEFIIQFMEMEINTLNDKNSKNRLTFLLQFLKQELSIAKDTPITLPKKTTPKPNLAVVNNSENKNKEVVEELKKRSDLIKDIQEVNAQISKDKAQHYANLEGFSLEMLAVAAALVPYLQKL